MNNNFGRQAYINPNFPSYRSGMGETVQPYSPQNHALAALDQNVMDRATRIQFLQQFGDPFFLPLDYDIGTTPAANTPFTRQTPNLDFDILIVGLVSNLRLSKIQIKDSSRQRDIINSPVPLWLVSQFVTTTASYTNSCWAQWQAPYWLAPRTGLSVTILADGTESNGVGCFLCKMPPSTAL
jgi:hypothetical protein